jgi:hypothetical protein
MGAGAILLGQEGHGVTVAKGVTCAEPTATKVESNHDADTEVLMMALEELLLRM